MLTSAAGLALSYAGFAALCFSMGKHQRQVLRRPLAPTASVALRAVGSALLALTLLLTTESYPGSLGFVVWFGLLTAGALPLALLLPYAPRAAVATAACAPLAAVLALAWP